MIPFMTYRETMILSVPTDKPNGHRPHALRRVPIVHIDVWEIYNERSRAEDAKRSQTPQ